MSPSGEWLWLCLLTGAVGGLVAAHLVAPARRRLLGLAVASAIAAAVVGAAAARDSTVDGGPAGANLCRVFAALALAGVAGRLRAAAGRRWSWAAAALVGLLAGLQAGVVHGGLVLAVHVAAACAWLGCVV